MEFTFFPIDTQLYSYCAAIYLNGFFCFVLVFIRLSFATSCVYIALVLRYNFRFNQIVIRMYYHGNAFSFPFSLTLTERAHTKTVLAFFFCCVDITFRFD